jgi:hypothetical protein
MVNLGNLVRKIWREIVIQGMESPDYFAGCPNKTYSENASITP